MKEVIKRLGQTISLVEIDDLLAKFCPLGVDAICVPFSSSHVGEEIGVVISNATSSQVDQMRESLETQVPEFMRPRVLICSNEKIRTESGKPTRWKFNHLFSAYEEASLQKIIVVRNP